MKKEQSEPNFPTDNNDEDAREHTEEHETGSLDIAQRRGALEQMFGDTKDYSEENFTVRSLSDTPDMIRIMNYDDVDAAPITIRKQS